MSVGIKVTPEQLQELSSRVAGGSGQIEGQLQSLAAALGPLRADWVGSASSGFESLWSEWQAAAQNLHEALTGISALLAKAGSSYAEMESQIAGSFAAR